MKLAITERKEEVLLGREKITTDIAFEGAVPSRKNITDELAKKAQVDPQLIVLSKVTSSFGEGKAGAIAYAYQSKDKLEKVEEKRKFTRTGYNQVKKEEAKPEAAK